MNWYRVRLVGRNLVRIEAGRRELHAFVTTRLVQAGSEEEAAETALALIYEVPELAQPLNGPDDPLPLVQVDTVEPVSTFTVE